MCSQVACGLVKNKTNPRLWWQGIVLEITWQTQTVSAKWTSSQTLKLINRVIMDIAHRGG